MENKIQRNVKAVDAMLKKSVLLGLFFFLLGITASTAGAVALSDKVIQQMKDNGTFDAYVEQIRQLRAQGMDQPGKKLLGNNLALGVNEAVTHRVLVILVDFDDKYSTSGYAATTAQDFDSMLFSDALNPTGSMKNFYYENSYGNYIIEGDVVGWYRVPFSYTEFGSYGSLGVNFLINYAIGFADNDVNFDQYDNDGDGYVEGVIIVHAGTGAEESGNPNEIHSHMSQIAPRAADNVFVSRYTIQPEESAGNHSMSAIGVFCHEWGHILGLPDLYDTDYSSSGLGKWSLMASGNYNGQSRVPAHFDAWCKKELGWVQPIRVTTNMIAVEFPAVEAEPVVYSLNKNGAFASQYWLVENRANTGFDTDLPGYGLMIYHIDESQSGNTNDWHPLVMVEQADGRFDLQSGSSGDIGDSWPNGDQARDFHDKSTPGSKYYVGTSSQVGVWNISDEGPVMTADLEVLFSRPWVEATGILLRDNTYGDADGVPEAGEKIQLILTLANDWAQASDISVSMTTDDPALTIVEGTQAFPALAMGQTASNVDTPFEFQIPDVYESRIDSFYFVVTANGGTYEVSVAAEANVGRPQLLIVDDDNGDPDQLQQYLAWPLYNKRTPSETWQKKLSGSPTSSDLNKYHAVMWLTGDARSFILSQDDLEAMRGYLDGGGNLFLTGQGLASQLKVQDPQFLNDYLKADYYDSTFNLQNSLVLKSSGGTAFDGMKQVVLIGNPGPANQTVSDHLVPVNGGEAEYEFYGTPLTYGAISYHGNYKTIFFTFGFEAVRSNDDRFATQSSLVSAIIDFFGDIPTDVGDPDNMAINLPAYLSLSQNYPNPFNPVTNISYVITGAGPRVDRTRLEIFNILGQSVRILVDRDEVPGQYMVAWDGYDQQGSEVASGLYFYRLTRGDQKQTRKMILLK